MWRTLIIIFILGSILFYSSQYEGKNAKEWFDAYRQADYSYRQADEQYQTIKSEYDELKSCVDSSFHETAEEIRSSCL